MPDNHEFTFKYMSEQRPGTIPGDIIVILKTSKHSRFERKGNVSLFSKRRQMGMYSETNKK